MMSGPSCKKLSDGVSELVEFRHDSRWDPVDSLQSGLILTDVTAAGD